MSFGDYSESMTPAGGRRRAPSFLMASSHGGSSSLRDADFSCGHRSHYGPLANHRPRQNSVISICKFGVLFHDFLCKLGGGVRHEPLHDVGP
jgi:hypothetical protein